MTAPGLTPLQLYLREERGVLADILRDLRDAAADASRRMVALARKDGLGARVRRAQLGQVRRELLTVQQELWESVETDIKRSGVNLGRAAAEADRALQVMLFQRAGRTLPEQIVEGQRAFAERTVLSYFSRRKNNIPLSRRVYRTRQLSQGWVDRVVNRVILQGGSWQELARAVRPLISPDAPGGVSFAAKRLARTEMNNAFHTAQRAVNEENPYTTGMTWHLSNSHPTPDACDLVARGHSQGRPAGVYDKGEVPDKPHPQCLCYAVSIPMDEDDFLASLVESLRPSSAA
jgi:hypothetical protein